MSFKHYETEVELPDEVWAALPNVQFYLSQHGTELRIIIVPADERFELAFDQESPEVSWVPDLRFV